MINFNGARLLGYDHNHVFLGDNFRYATRKNITIEGSIYTLENTEGVAPVWEGISGFVGSATDYDIVLVNGVNFGRGRVENISFSESIDIKRKDYRATIVTFESGNLFNLTGQYYSGLNLENPDAPVHLLESFSEEFSFSVDETNIGEYTQGINLKFVSGAAQGNTANPIDMAKLFASGLLYSSPGFSLFTTAYDQGFGMQGKKFITESYNQITNECSFETTQKMFTGSMPYIFTHTHSMNTDEGGVTSVQEEGRFEGLVDDRYTFAASGFSNEFTNAYSRANEVFTHYAPDGAYPLNNSRVSYSRQDNKFEGYVEYSVTYNNDPRIKDTYTWEYSQEIDRLDDCIFNVTERGSIKGLSLDCTQQDIYSNAVAAWTTIKGDLYDRATDFYQSTSSQSRPLKVITNSETLSAFQGTIEYDVRFTDDPRQNIAGFKKIDYSVEDANPVHRVNKFNILGVKEIVQPQQSSTEGQRAVSLQIQGYKTNDLDDYLTYAQTFLNAHKPTALGDTFLKDCKYNWNPLDSSFSIEAVWTFFGTKAFTSVTV